MLKKTDGWMDGWVGGWMDGWMDGRMATALNRTHYTMYKTQKWETSVNVHVMLFNMYYLPTITQVPETWMGTKHITGDCDAM
jgi:hypothetical protein